MTLILGDLTACGATDALECGVEFQPTYPKVGLFDGFQTHTMPPRAQGGSYSDDTQYKLAVAEWYLEDGEDASRVKDYITRAYIRDPRGGSPRMEAYFNALASGKEAVLEPTDGSGAAMRAGLFGLMDVPLETMLAMVEAQSAFSHNAEGTLAAKAAALMVRLMREYTLEKDGSAKDWLSVGISEELKVEFLPSDKRPSNKGIACVRAALYAMQQARTLRELLQVIADMGGDTDTVGVIAMSAAWFSPEFRNDLPDFMWHTMENGIYGRGYLRQVELRVLEKLNRGRARKIYLRAA